MVAKDKEAAEVVAEEVVEEKKKGFFGKAKDAILPDPEEQAAIISTMVRITVLAWSGGILTLNYVAIPGVPQQKIDRPFRAHGNAVNGNCGPPPVTAKDIEAIIAKAGPTQTIRVEQAPLKIIGVSDVTDEKPYKM